MSDFEDQIENEETPDINKLNMTKACVEMVLKYIIQEYNDKSLLSFVWRKIKKRVSILIELD